MSDEPDRTSGSISDSERFEEWLQQTADAEGIATQELIDNMLSSYWILNELTGIVDESKTGHQRRESSSDSDFELSKDQESEPDPVKQATDHEPDVGSDEITAIVTQLDDIHEQLQTVLEARPVRTSDQHRSDESRVQDGSPTETLEFVRMIDDIERRLDALSTQIDEVESHNQSLEDEITDSSELITSIPELETQLETLLEEIEELQTRQEVQKEALSDKLQLLYGEIDDVSSQIDQLATKAEFDSVDTELNDLQQQYTRFETDIQDEFDEVERAFEYVVEELDAVSTQFDEVTESYEADLVDVQDYVSTQEQLSSLRTDALRQGIRNAACGHCDRVIDIALLDRPSCPHCSETLTTVARTGSKWNPFDHHTLLTEDAERTEDDPVRFSDFEDP